MHFSDLIKQAKTLKVEKKAAEALCVVQEILEANPNHVEALGLAGTISLELNDTAAAIDYLTAAAELVPSATVYNDLAIAYLCGGDHEKAINQIIQAAALAPDGKQIHETQTAIEKAHADARSRRPEPVSAESSYKFSIVMPHHDGTISDKFLMRALEALEAQTYKNFEVLLYHDGHLTRPLPRFDDLTYSIRVTITDRRYNDWGHSLRDMGIRAATGEYIVHHNADNILYPNALEEVCHLTKPENYPSGHFEDGTNWYVHPHIIIFPIYQIGWVLTGKYSLRFTPPRHDLRILLSGFPAKLSLIDAMQLVMRRSKWLSYGGWYDKSKESDGVMYERFVTENGARYTAKVLGEHW